MLHPTCNANENPAWPLLPSSIAKRVGVKLGAHFGLIIASRLGGGSQQQITATGDTVNIASRLMEVAAEHEVVLCFE